MDAVKFHLPDCHIQRQDVPRGTGKLNGCVHKNKKKAQCPGQSQQRLNRHKTTMRKRQAGKRERLGREGFSCHAVKLSALQNYKTRVVCVVQSGLKNRCF